MNVEDLYWFSFTLVTIVSYFTFKLLTRYRDFFTVRGVAFEKPHFIYGNLNDVLSGKISSLELIQQFYRKFENARIFGFYNYLSPAFYIRDPELIEKLWVQEGAHFANHGYFLDESKDTILGNQLHLLKDKKWSQMRCTLGAVLSTQTVTSMTSLIRTNSIDLVDYLKSSSNTEMEFKEVALKHTFNVVASCAFGVKLNTFTDENDKLCHVGYSVMYGNNPVQTFKTMLFYLFPKVMSKMNVQLMEASHSKYFLSLLKSATKNHHQKNTNRSSVIQLLNQATQGELRVDEGERAYLQIKDVATRTWSDEELVAQCVAFFGSSFESMVNLISFACYELAANPNIQQKLLEEIRSSLKDGPLTYETVNEITYLDMVVCETLRKWPASPSCDRECSQDYLLAQDDLRLQFRKGDSLWVSVWAMHRDERYFPDPERYDPERFGETRKGEIRANTYLPFGIGQRNCIGRRLALLVVKITLVDLIQNFQLNLGSKLKEPLRLAKASFALEPDGGFWLQLTHR
ncbi:cytochrome P450 9b2-like [Malaya genurostris]|uniref:cytochrome P450 9b2-like n=1 Tax=Malaya genurostris TaxID=325434 RepID=UPI0026F3B427|nr:cytochrome P450 9b2-like [Malaya genurostris]